MIAEIINYITTVSILGYEIWRYIAFFLILIITHPIAKFSIYLTGTVLKRWAEKTEFKLDDILIKSLNPPISMFAFAFMFYLASLFFADGIFSNVLQRIFNFLIIIPVVYFLIKFSTEAIGYYLKENQENGKKKVNEVAIDVLMSVVRIALFLIGILLILANMGYNVSALLAGLGVGGLAFALAAQDVLKNFFAGIALIFDKTFGKGERVNFQGNTGFIEEMKLRSTKLRTYDGTLLTIPNAMLADNIVENINKVQKVKVKMTIGVTYDTSSKKLKEAKKIIEKAILAEELTKKEKFYVYFDNFSAYSLDIQVIYYESLKMDAWPERVLVKERINFAIKEGFEKAGIEFAFPTQTIELKK